MQNNYFLSSLFWNPTDNGFADEPFKSQILYCFNCVLCKDERNISFWQILLKNINSKFSSALLQNELEMDVKTFVSKHVDVSYLFRKLLSICSVRLTAQAGMYLFCLLFCCFVYYFICLFTMFVECVCLFICCFFICSLFDGCQNSRVKTC
jgi:hypothetical protein